MTAWPDRSRSPAGSPSLAGPRGQQPESTTTGRLAAPFSPRMRSLACRPSCASRWRRNLTSALFRSCRRTRSRRSYRRMQDPNRGVRGQIGLSPPRAARWWRSTSRLTSSVSNSPGSPVGGSADRQVGGLLIRLACLARHAATLGGSLPSHHLEVIGGQEPDQQAIASVIPGDAGDNTDLRGIGGRWRLSGGGPGPRVRRGNHGRRALQGGGPRGRPPARPLHPPGARPARPAPWGSLAPLPPLPRPPRHLAW